MLHPHSDTECIAKSTAWPHGPGGWGFSEAGAHTILISSPRWDPDNTTVREEDRIRARKLYHHQCRRKHTSPCPLSVKHSRGFRLGLYLHSFPNQAPKTQDPSHTAHHGRARRNHDATQTNTDERAANEQSRCTNSP